MTTVIYVAGYGRGGSTLLDLLLGAHPSIRSIGEAGMLWDQLDQPGAECSCGRKLADCEIWGPFQRLVRSREDLRGIRQEAFAAEHSLWRFWPGWRRSDAAYREGHHLLFAHVSGDMGDGLVVDSSKTAYRFAWRPWSLSKRCGVDVRILHLIRHPSLVLASCLQGRNQDLARGLKDRRRFEVPRTLMGWNLANLFAVLNGRIAGKARYLRVDFDELLRSPAKSLARIGLFLGIDMESVIARVQQGRGIPTGHLIGGNRMARASEVRLSNSFDQGQKLQGAYPRLATCLLSAAIYRLLRPAA